MIELENYAGGLLVQGGFCPTSPYSCAALPTQNKTSAAHSPFALPLNDPHLLIVLCSVRSFDLEKQVALSHPCCYRLPPDQKREVPAVLTSLQIEPLFFFLNHPTFVLYTVNMVGFLHGCTSFQLV